MAFKTEKKISQWFSKILVLKTWFHLGHCRLCSIWWPLYTVKRQWNCGFGKAKGWPRLLYTGDRYIQISKYKTPFSGSFSVTVIYRVTAIYRAVIYRFDCTRISWTVSFAQRKAHIFSLKLIHLIRIPVNRDNGHRSLCPKWQTLIHCQPRFTDTVHLRTVYFQTFKGFV